MILPLGRCILLLTRQRSNLQVVVLPYRDLPALAGDGRRHCHSTSSPPDPRPMAGSIDGSMAARSLRTGGVEEGEGWQGGGWRRPGSVAAGEARVRGEAEMGAGGSGAGRRGSGLARPG
jgi:hypothetical protein